MIADYINRPATLHRWTEGGRDDSDMGDYGPATFADKACLVDVQQQSSNEIRGGRIIVVGVWVGFFRPPGMDGGVESLSPNDELTVPQLGRFAFEGDPWLVRNPRTQEDLHWQATLRKVS